MRPLLALLLLLPACAAPAPPASPASTALTAEQQAVMEPVNRLFDAMRAGDSTMARAAFHPAATMSGITLSDGERVVRTNPVDGFIRAIGAPHDEVWDEKIWDPIVLVDDYLATAWVPFAFHAGERLSHCGVNAFQLVRGSGGWQIMHIADTRRTEGCVVPAHAR